MDPTLESVQAELEKNKPVRFALAANTSVDMKARTMVATIASSTLSRNGFVLVPSGIELTEYRSNPVVMWSHEYGLPPIGINLWIKHTNEGMVAKTKFAQRPAKHEGEWFPDTVLHLYNENILKGMSVGVQHKVIIWKEDFREEDLKKFPQLKDQRAFAFIPESNLLEYSCCSIPQNAKTLAQALTMGIPAPMASLLGFLPEKEVTSMGLSSTAGHAVPEEQEIDYGLDSFMLVGHEGTFAKKGEGEGEGEGTIVTSSYEGKILLLHLDKENKVQRIVYPVDAWKPEEAERHCRHRGGIFQAYESEELFQTAKLPITPLKPAIVKQGITSKEVIQGIKGINTNELIGSIGIQQMVTDAVLKIRGRV